MAPDKIFIDEDLIAFHVLQTKHDGDIEYIRKDALLELLKKEYETTSWYYEKMKHVTGCIGDNSSSGKAEAYKKVIDKIESL